MNLTVRSLLIAAGIALLGIAGQWGGEAWAGWWRLPAALWILALTAEGLVSRRPSLRALRRLPPVVHLGQPAEGQWQISNDGRTPVRLITLERFPDGLSGEEQPRHWRLGPGETVERPFTVTATRLGSISWSHWYVRRRGPFGLAWWTHDLSVPSQLDVRPDRLRKRERARATTQGSGDLNARTTGHGVELQGLRPYRPGDPLRAVDWKATARSRRPVVRLFSEEQQLSLILLLDAGQAGSLYYGQLSRLGHFVNVAARLGERVLHDGGQVGLIAFSDRVISSRYPLKGLTGAHRLREELARVEPQPVQANPLAAALHLRQVVRQRSLVVLLTDMDLATQSNQLIKAAGLLHAKHLPLTVGLMDAAVLEQTEQPARDWLDPYQTAAALETRHLWSATQMRLERMGVPVALASPEQLDRTVFHYYERIRERRAV